tara:strand:- start:1198 stop:2148 length:951 start_codon:yes stop_codon:yes gene_type:complete
MKISKVAIQMDSIDSIDLEFDTSFLIGKEAQNRGYDLFYYNPVDLEYENGSVFASGYFIELYDNEETYYKYLSTNKEKIDLVNFDVVLIRQDPPFNMNYISSTYLLDQISSSTVVLNNPTSIRNCSEKIYPFEFNQYIAPTIITQKISTLKKFIEENKDIITKPLYGNGGEGIYRTKIDDKKIQGIDDTSNILEEPIMAQRYIPEIIEGDRRIILIDGEYMGSVARIPQDNNIKANFHAGGKPEKSELIYRDKEICDALKKDLKEKNLFLTGIDVIGNYLTEINVTSPTGLKQINKLNKINLEKIYWNRLEDKFFN